MCHYLGSLPPKHTCSVSPQQVQVGGCIDFFERSTLHATAMPMAMQLGVCAAGFSAVIGPAAGAPLQQ